MAATDARPVPRKNAAFRYYFPIRKNDGTLITTWAGMDSEVSIDGGSFADCTSEATEIGTTGCGYLDLTAAEMNGDAVVLKVTVTNTSALTAVVTFFPEESGDYRVDASLLATASALSDVHTDLTTLTISTASLATAVGVIDDFLDTEVAAIKAKTDNLPTDPADASDIAAAFTSLNTKVDTIDDFLDTEVAAIKAKTDLIPDIAITGTVSGTPTTTAIVGASGVLSSTNDIYNGAFLIFTSGTAKGLGQQITDYVGSTRTFTTDAFSVAAADTDTFIIAGRVDA